MKLNERSDLRFVLCTLYFVLGPWTLLLCVDQLSTKAQSTKFEAQSLILNLTLHLSAFSIPTLPNPTGARSSIR
jgi:hypothetical protein